MKDILVSIPYESGKSGHQWMDAEGKTLLTVSIPYESGKSGHSGKDSMSVILSWYQSLMNQGKVATPKEELWIS